jgi:hypothetical protein
MVEMLLIFGMVYAGLVTHHAARQARSDRYFAQVSRRLEEAGDYWTRRRGL